MTDFNIENLEGKGITAEVLEGGCQYSTYELFAKAAGHSEAVRQYNALLVSADNLEGQTVDVIARGSHHHTGRTVYVCKTSKGQKFLIGGDGVRLVEIKLSNFTTDQLYKEIERRAFEAGFKAGQAQGFTGCDLGEVRTAVQPSRGHIVEQAKNEVEELIAHGKRMNEKYGYIGNHICRTNYYTVDFHVNPKKRAVTAVVETTDLFGGTPSNGKKRSVGVAKCDPNDCFNEFIGKSIALHRALGLEVPEELLNAPEPEGKKAGDIVAYQEWSLGTKHIRLVDPKESITPGKTAQVGSTVSEQGRVINDTARYK
jgi:hypothetical protein